MSISISKGDGEEGSIGDYLMIADDKIGDHHYAGYDKLADGLRLIAEVVDRMMISNREEMDDVLTLIRAAHDRLEARVLYDLSHEAAPEMRS